MLQYSSYIICGTPRSGSTLLCEMLAATGISGRPNSYFREQSIANWADRWGIERANGTDDVQFDRLYVPAMLKAGASDTGIFGIRIMWGSVAEATRRLSRVNGGPADAQVQFEQAFGSPLYIHLSRADKVAQAISLVRAEQSGLWHLAADGSVFEGAAVPQPNVYDAQRIAEVFSARHNDDIAWESFFATHAIEPLRLSYETMTADPQAALARVLDALGRDRAVAQTVSVGTRKMASSESQQWADRFRRENGGKI